MIARATSATVADVPEFAIEMYVPGGRPRSVAHWADVLRREAQRRDRDGAPIRLVRWVVVPADETGLLICESDSLDTVRDAADQAGLDFERVIEAVTGDGPSTGEVTEVAK